MADEQKLRLWQERLAKGEAAYAGQLSKMERREAAYRGDRALSQRVAGDRKRKAAHVRNLTAELIEAQVDSSVPQPKVTARRKKDEAKARLIEDMLRNELNRMPFEEINDLMERTVPIQGGACFLVEWDSTRRTHTTMGELSVTPLHPRQVIPQPGVYTGVEDMDYLLLKLPQTRETIRRRYGVDLPAGVLGTSVPGTGGADAGEPSGDDMVTQYVAYYRNDSGGIGRYSWVGDTELEDLEDYQSRQGGTRPDGGTPSACRESLVPSLRTPKAGDDVVAEGDGEFHPRHNTSCFHSSKRGNEHPASWQRRLAAEYKPDVFPVILQKNVSVYGQFLGESDVDKVADQQNTVNRIETKIIEKLVKSGSYLLLPDEASIRADAEEMKVIRPGSPANAQMIGVKDLEGNISQDLAYLNQVYEEARQTIGMTDSFQGRMDDTAISGRAKQFAASQAAGRLESKRVMKDAAYAALFEAMFKFRLAYADEKRPVTSRDIGGNPVYEEFDRFDFLEQDAAGEWYWNDQFLFSCDAAAPLANNREAMWQETRQNLQSGAFGDPRDTETLILFWTKMELLHYPGAGETRRFLEQRLQKMQARQAQQAQQIQQLQARQAQQAGGNAGRQRPVQSQ